MAALEKTVELRKGLTVVLRDLTARESFAVDDLIGLISESMTRLVVLKTYAVASVRKIRTTASVAAAKATRKTSPEAPLSDWQDVDATTRAGFEGLLADLTRSDLDQLVTAFLSLSAEVAETADP